VLYGKLSEFRVSEHKTVKHGMFMMKEYIMSKLESQWSKPVIVGTPVMIYYFLLTVLSERHFRLFAN